MTTRLRVQLQAWTQVLALVGAVVGAPASVLAESSDQQGAAAPGEQQSQQSPSRYVLTGRVLDSMRAPIAGARVTASPSGGGPAVVTATDQRGDFTLSLQTGAYTITAAADGFLTGSQSIVSAQSAGFREFVLEVAGFRDSVTVSADGYRAPPVVTSATKTATPLHDIPQSVSVVSSELIKDQLMTSVGDVVRYMPGVTLHQGENNRDQVIIRGNSSSADFFINGVRDDVQYYRDLYNLDRVEALKGPNAMIFGRGGGGGVINRVTKQAGFRAFRDVVLQVGSQNNRRITADVDQPLSDSSALRVNGVYENSDSFRQGVNLERYAVNPTVTFSPGDRTTMVFGYERMHDGRVADRGITSFQRRPADVDIATYYGDPENSSVRADVNLASALIEHQTGRGATIRNHTLVGDYDRFYQNYVPGAVTQDKQSVSLSAYNNATARRNFFNQTDVIYETSTGHVKHTLLAGIEAGHQLTDNFRNTGYFNNASMAYLAPYSNPTISVPITFRQSATDADNHVRTLVLAAYAQDQIELSRTVHVVGGLRVDRFDLEYHNNRNGDTLGRIDAMLSPRLGVVVKPAALLALYATSSVSFLPSSGDQFASLTAITQQVEPEKFTNYEMGAKWDPRPDLSLTAAVYQLDRTNTRSVDPNDATRIVQTGRQRSRGYEMGWNGSLTRLWRIAGGYAYTDAVVTSATAAARAGARVAQTPLHTVSFWNHYQLHARAAVGAGVIRRSDMFAAIDNTVTLPGYTRVDAAAYVTLTKSVQLQANVENLFNKTYHANADNNTNITPGAPRALRVAVSTRF